MTLFLLSGELPEALITKRNKYMIGLRSSEAVTLVELIIVITIVFILIAGGSFAFLKQKQISDRKNAKNILLTLQEAAWDYRARTQSCTSSFKDLDRPDPHSFDKVYKYTINCPSFVIKACRKKAPDDCLSINLYGEFIE
jgi:type II secretory pathway pseudopilin PulG